MTRGLVAGTFLPPRAGDGLLIDSARAQCDELVVLVGAKDDEAIPAALRAAWLAEAHPDCTIRVVEGDPEDDTVGAREALRILGNPPEIVFGADQSRAELAKRLGAKYVAVEPGGAELSETLPAAVRAYYVPRLVLAGAESTGKTTLARTLAAWFGLPWVAEYGREYTETKYRDGMLTDAWRPDEFVHIAREQERREDAAARGGTPPLVIADTDAFVTGIWYERYLDTPPPHNGWPLDRAHRRIYVLPEPDVPFVADAIRDGEYLRGWMHERTLELIRERGGEAIVLRGSYEARTAEAIRLVEELLGRVAVTTP